MPSTTRWFLVLLCTAALVTRQGAHSQAPIVKVNSAVLTGLEGDSTCCLINSASRLLCASSQSTTKTFKVFKNIYDTPTLEKTVPLDPSAWGGNAPESVVGNSEGFVLVATSTSVFLGASTLVEGTPPIQPIRRLTQDLAAVDGAYFTLFLNNRLVVAMEHRFIPGTYYPALTLSTGTTDPYIAAAMSIDDSTMIVVTKALRLKRMGISVNALGRITVTSALEDFLFQVDVPWRNVQSQSFYFIRERGPNYGSGDYREVLLGAYSPDCDAAVCTGCTCPTTGGYNWYVLTESFSTSPYCPGVRYNTFNTTAMNCVVYDAGLNKFGVRDCDTRTQSQYIPYNPTKFTPGCSAARNRGAPYLNFTTISSNSLFDLPSGTEDIYNTGISVPTYVARSSYVNDAAVVMVNGVVVISAMLKGTDCADGLSTNTVVGATPICIEGTRGTRFPVVMPLKGDPSLPGSPRIPKPFSTYKFSFFGNTIDHAFPIIAYEALNGSTVIASLSYVPSPVIPPLPASSATSRIVSAQQINAITYGRRPYFAVNTNYVVEDVARSGDLLLVFQGGLWDISIYARPRHRIQSSSFYFAAFIESDWFNTSQMYASCASQVSLRILVVDTATQDGVVVGGLYQVKAPVFVPGSMVLDSVSTFSGNRGSTVSFFVAPCTAMTTLTLQLGLTVNALQFSLVITLLPSGQPLPTAGPTPAPTPPPRTRTKLRETVTATLTEDGHSASSSMTKTIDETCSQTMMPTASLAETRSDVLLSASRTDADATPTVPPFTPEPTISSKLPMFLPLPPNATNWTHVVPPPLAFPSGQVAAIAALASGDPPPSTYAIRVALPFSGVGELFTITAPSVAFGSVLSARADGLELFLRTTNVSEALRFITTSVAAVLNPEVLERGLAGRIPVNITIWGEEVIADGPTSGIRTVQRASWIYPLNASIPINAGPRIAPRVNCSRSVMRGGRFDIDLGAVIEHPLNMSLAMTISGARQPIPASIRVDCNHTGSCTIRGVATDDEAVSYRIGGSDGYYAVFASCTLIPFYVSLRVQRGPTQPLYLNVKAAQTFTQLIPLDVFVSSLSITMLSVTLASGYPLPPSINFEQPNTLRGVVPTVDILPLRVKAVDLYSEAYYVFYLNSTDTAPMVVSTWEPVRILAGQSFSTVRYHSGKIVDPDAGDVIACTADAASLSSLPWVSVATVSPGTIQVSGTAPTGSSPLLAFPHDQNITVRLVCSDGVLAVNASLVLHMQEALTPQQFAPLPNITAPAEETMQESIDVSTFFKDPAGGNVVLGAVATSSNGLAVWVQLQRVSDTVLQISGIPPVDQAGSTDGTTFPLTIRVRNAFGNETVGTMRITVTATTWQLILEYSALIYSLLGVLLTLFSLWFYWVPLVNTFTLRWRRVACPLMVSRDEEEAPTASQSDGLQEDPDGVLSYPVHKTCHELIGYVKLPDKVAGRLRRCLRCATVLSSYWDLQISHDKRLPKWLYLRGDQRAVFSTDEGDDGIEEDVVVHEVNVYGVILREYRCSYGGILAHLVAAGGVGSTYEYEAQLRGRGGSSSTAKKGQPGIPLLEEVGEDESLNNHVGGAVDPESMEMLLFEAQDDLGNAALKGNSSRGKACDDNALRDMRRQQMRMDAMRRQLVLQLQSSERGINAKMEEQLTARVGALTSKLDTLTSMLMQVLQMRNGNSGEGQSTRSSETWVGVERGGGPSTRRTTLHLPGGGDVDDRGDGDNIHFYDLDPHRVRDPLAELNRALRESDRPTSTQDRI